MSRYPHLLRPLQVAGVTLPNRNVMGAMHTRPETMDRPQERLAAFSTAREAGEIGLILTGGHIGACVPSRMMSTTTSAVASSTIRRSHRQKDDHIIPPMTTRALSKAVGSQDYAEIELGGSHVDVFVSGTPQGVLAKGIVEWLQA